MALQAPEDKKKSTPAPAPALRTLSSLDLFRGSRRVQIEHQGELYRLQITRQGKLILTK